MSYEMVELRAGEFYFVHCDDEGRKQVYAIVATKRGVCVNKVKALELRRLVLSRASR